MEDVVSKAPHPEAEFDRGQNLAPIEHMLIGSSTTYHGEFLNSDSFLEKVAGSGVVEKDMLIPAGFSKDDPEKLEEIRRAHVKQEHFRGMLSFLTNSQLGLSEEGYEPSIDLSQVNDDGTIDPHWRVFLFDVAGSKVDSNRERLSVETRIGALFSMEFKDGTDELYLSLRPEYQNDV